MSEHHIERPSVSGLDKGIDRTVEAVRRRLLILKQMLRDEVVARSMLVLILLVSAVVLWVNVRGQWFVYDEFDYLAPPDGASWLGWLITPHNEHTILFTKMWFSLLYSTIGLHGYWIYAVPMILSHMAGAVAVYKLLRLIVPSRALAVAATAPVLLMAAGVGTLTWAGQFQYTAATAAGMWALYCALSPTIGNRNRWIWMIALVLIGTFSGSAFIPLGVAAGFAAISLRRYILGFVTVLVPSLWFVLVRIFYDVPSYNSAHSIEQVLGDGPEFIFALLNKAVNDSIPVSESFTAPVIVASTIGVVGYLAARSSPIDGARARRTYLFLLLGLTLSLIVTLIGRLSRDVAESASGGYTYFILIAAIPIGVATLARFSSKSRLAITVIVILLASWSAVNIVTFGKNAQGLADFKEPNAVMLAGAAFLSTRDFPVASDAPPSPDLAPTVSWGELLEMVKDGRIASAEPSPQAADQLSLNLQWTTSDDTTSSGRTCSVVEANGSVELISGEAFAIEPLDGFATDASLTYPTSDAIRHIAVPTAGVEVSTVVDRTVTLTASSRPLTFCR